MSDQKKDTTFEVLRVKRDKRYLDLCQGKHTSMISLILPPGDLISQTQSRLQTEYGTASNIKSRANQKAVLAAICSVQHILKEYNKARAPENGLIIYCGTADTPDREDEIVKKVIWPFKPIKTTKYLCSNKFYTEVLGELMESDQKYGFIIIDGEETLYGISCGKTLTKIDGFTVDLPKKHGRGGQSALRFARLRQEKRHNYLRKIAEHAVQLFLTNDKVNVAKLVLAGRGNLKNELYDSEMLDSRLHSIIHCRRIDTPYGGQNGFIDAKKQSAEELNNFEFLDEQTLLLRFFSELEANKSVFGVKKTLHALDKKEVETLIVWEALPIQRHVYTDSKTGKEKIDYLEKTCDRSSNSCTGTVTSNISLLEWLEDEYKDSCVLKYVSETSQLGSQFVKGMHGIGALLRYRTNEEEFTDDDLVDERSEENYDDPEEHFYKSAL